MPEQLLAWLVAILGPAMLLVGGPAQVIKNKVDRRRGQPLIMVVLALGFHLANVGYGLCLHKVPVILPSAAGVAFWGYIAYQYVRYEIRKEEPRSETPDA